MLPSTAAPLAVLPSTAARIVGPALIELGSHHPQLTVTCLVADQAQLRELTLGAVDVVLGQRYHHLPDATPRGIEVTPLLGDPLLVVTAADQAAERPLRLRERAAHSLVLPPPTTDCGRISTALADHPILRLLFAAPRHAETVNPATAAVVAALRTVARDNRPRAFRRPRTRRRAAGGSGARSA